MRARAIVGVFAVVLLISGVGLGQSHGRTVKYTIGPISSEGVTYGDCATFKILVDGAFIIKGTTVFDKSGNPVRDISHYKVLGRERLYNSMDPSKELMGGPGEVENQRYDFATGLVYGSGIGFKVVVPGYGPIFVENGHYIYNVNNGTFLFNTAHNQFIEKDFEALCDYLK